MRTASLCAVLYIPLAGIVVFGFLGRVPLRLWLVATLGSAVITGGLAAAITIPICASGTVGSRRGQVGLFLAIATSLLILLFALRAVLTCT